MSTDVLENGNAPHTQTQTHAELNPPFEGPEKLLEIWFEPSESGPSDDNDTGRRGLRTVSREKWEEMLDIVRCKVLNVIHGKELDAYLLR
jgi:S-adenosylmethionine decarboxylase